MGLVLGLAGLPLYMIANFCGLWSLGDIAGLLLIFTLLGYTTPQWQPLQWLTGKRNRRATALRARKVLREQMQGISLWSMSAAQRLELNRRVQRALAEEAAAPTPALVTATEEAARVKTKKPVSGTSGNERSPALGLSWLATGNGGAWNGLKWYLIIRISLSSLTGLGPTGGIWHVLRGNLPRAVGDLLPSMLLSWPLIAARLLWAPLPFLAFHLPPIVLAVPLVVFVNLQRNLNLASQVSAAESFWTLRRIRALTAYSRWLWALAVLALLGYCWNATITLGLAADLLPDAPPTTDAALAALWTLFITTGALLGALALRAPFITAVRGETSFNQSWYVARGIAVRVVAFTFGSYFVLCWMGGYSGTGPLWQQRLVPTLCSFAAFCLAALGCSALGAALQPQPRKLWIRAVVFWLVYGPLLALACLIFGDDQWPLNMSAPLITASPLMSLYSFFRFNLDSPDGVAWWLGPLVQAVVGTLALGLAGTVLWQRLEGPSTEAWHPLAAVGRVLWFTLRCFYRVFGSIGCRPLTMLLRFAFRTVDRVWGPLSAALSRFDNAIAQRGIAFDNALLTADLRSRLRRGGWCAQWLAWQLIAIVIWLSWSHPWNISAAPSARNEWADNVAFSVLGCIWVVAIFSVADVATTFLRDRANGALMFVYLTPMSDRAILIGKLAAYLLRAGGQLLAMALPLLSAIVVGLGVADYTPLWIALCSVLLAYTTLLCQALLQLATALLSKSTAANSSGALFSVGLEFCLFAAAIKLASMTNFNTGVALALVSFFAALHLILAHLFWRLSLRTLARRRFGDIDAVGSRTG
jgi:hypothetical protein